MSYAEKLENNKIAFAAAVLACWTAYGLFFGTQSYLRATSAGRPASFPGYLITWLICGYCWALLTVPVLRFIRRFSLDRLGWSPFLLTHIFSAPVVGSVALAVYVILATCILPGRGRTMVEFYQAIYLDEIQSEILVYLLIVGVATVYQKVTGRVTTDRASEPTPHVNEKMAVVESAASENGNSSGYVAGPVSSYFGNGHASNGRSNGNGYLRRISIKDNGRITLVDVDDIRWISSYGNYLKVHTSAARHIYRETMTAIEQKLDPDRFVRIRRSAIVRIDDVKELRPVSNGEYQIVLKNDTVLTSTRRYRKNLEALMQR